jgi:hypothetical protein
MMFLALGGWALWATLRSAKSWLRAFQWLIGVFLAPTTLLFLLWLINLSQLENGGGPQENPWIIAVSTLSLMVGGPEFGDWSLLIGTAAAAAVIVEILLRKNAGDDRWVCWLLMVLIPAALIAVTGRKEVYPRYFLGTVILFDLALAHLAARVVALGSQKPAGRVAGARLIVIAVLIATLIGNTLQLSRLYRYGRGHAQAVVEFLRDHSGPGPIDVGSDQSFRHGFVLGYFAYRLKLTKPLIYRGTPPWPPPGPHWILTHSLAETWDPEPSLVVHGNRYELRRVFPYAGLSGWHTAVYENVTAKKSNE